MTFNRDVQNIGDFCRGNKTLFILIGGVDNQRSRLKITGKELEG